MGNEMGNNNTSAIKEEDNISEADKKNLLEDTSEHTNGISQDVHADTEENQNILTSIAKNVMEKASNASNDITIELGKDTPQEDGHADDVKEKTQTIPTAEAKDAQEKATWFASNNTTSMLENDSLEEDTYASNINIEIQMHPTAEAEDVQEKAIGLASEDTTTEPEKVSLIEESHADDVQGKIPMIPTAEAKDVHKKAAGLIPNNTESMLENDSLEGDTHESDMNMENQMHPIAEAKDVQEKATEMTSYYTRSSVENDLSKGKDDQEIAARLGYDDKTSEVEDKPQEEKQDGNIIIPITNGTDVQEEATILASDDSLNLRNSFGGEGEGMIGVTLPEKSTYAGSVEGENCESLSSSSLEGTEECGKQEDSCIRKRLSVTHNHHLNVESSIKQDEEETTVLTSNAVNISNDSELQESPSVHHDELVKVLSEHSIQGTESLLKDTLLDANSHSQQIKDDVLEKDMESQENMSDGRDGNEFGNALIDTSETTSDPPSIGNNNSGNPLTKVNYATEDCLNPFPESFVVDYTLKSDHEENCKVLNLENNLSRCGPTKENPHDYKPDQCMKELKEYKSGMVNTYDMTIGSNGDYNGERHKVLDSSVFGIANSDQVEEPKVAENGLQFDAYVNNSNKASDENSAAPEEKHSVLPEAEAVFLVAGSTVVDCKHDKGENHNNETEDINEKPEAPYAMVKTSEETDTSEQCNSDLVTINGEESFSLQNSASLLHIYNYHQGNAEQTKSFTTTNMPNSGWKQTNDNKYFDATVDKLDSSDLTVPSLDLVDEEAIEKEGEDYSQHAEATSLTGTELTTSAATMSTEPCPNNSIFANGGYETRDSVTRLSTESNPDNPNISCQIQKSPSFKLNLRIEARPEESDQTPLLYQDKSANESLSNQTSLNLSNSIPHAEYDQCMIHSDEMPAEEKIVTMERIYSDKSKAPFIGLLREEEEEAHLLVMPQTQGNHAGTKKTVMEVSCTSPKGKEKRKSRSSFFSSCMCCATVAN